jgi:hypothetical protein
VYGRDPIAPDGHIGTDPRGARPVDQRAAVEDGIGALAEAARERLGRHWTMIYDTKMVLPDLVDA